MDELTVEELHKFDDLPMRQRQVAEAKSTETKKETESEIDGEQHLFGEDGFTFDDFLDIINPLQHIPVISTIYRELTGDQIAMMPRVLGGTLFGGPIGAGVAIVNAAIHQESGKDLGGHVMAMFDDEKPSTLAAKTTKSELDDIDWKTDRLAALPNAINISQTPAPIAAPTQAELEILQSELKIKQAAQVSSLFNPNLRPGAQNTVTENTASLTKPSAAEEQILALEKAVERLQQNKQAQTDTQKNAALNTGPTVDFKPAQTPQTPVTNPRHLAMNEKASAQNSAQNSLQSPANETSTAPSPWFSFNQPSQKISANSTGNPPLGALASKGGWFSDVMVSALTKYEQSKQLKQQQPAAAINQLN